MTIPMPVDSAVSRTLHGLNIETLQSRYMQNTASPTNVVLDVYSRIAAYHDKAVWISLVSQEDALKRAEQLASQYSNSAERPPLYGIPFSVKDSLDIAGMPTTLACPSYAYTATETAPVVKRVLDAGGILVGKTNLDQFATGLNGTRSPYGVPRCVHDAEYISGGSSSGAAVSVGAGLVSFAIATDTAGSTRVPAALNGLVGLKPTLGTISTVGLVPACKTADCVTIIAPSVETAMRALSTMRAYDEDDVYAREPEQLLMLARQPSWSLRSSQDALRFALPPQHLLDSNLSPQYLELFTGFVNALSKTGIRQVKSRYFEPFAKANTMLYGSSVVSQRLVAFKDYLDQHGFDQLHPVVRDIFAASTGLDAARAYEDIFELAKYKRLARRQFTNVSPGSDCSSTSDGVDFLLVPSTTTHPTIDEMLADPLELNKRLGTFTHFVNLLDLCAVSVPVKAGWKSRNGKAMPFGVTLISLPGRDRDLLAVAQQFMNMEIC